MVEKIRANWNARAEVAGQVDREVHDSARRHDRDAEIEKSSGYTRARSSTRCARCVAHAAAAAAAGGVSQSHADRSPQLSSTHDDADHPHATRSAALTIARGLVAALRRHVGLGAQRPPAAAAAAERHQHDDQQRPGRHAAPRFAVPDFIALSNDAGNRRRGEDDRPGAAGTISKFEREFALIAARHHHHDSAGDVDRRRAVRSLARGERRRRHRRHGAEDRRPASASRCGCTTCARGRRPSASEYTGAVASKRLFAHQIADDSTSSSARCAAWPGRS